IAICAQHVGVCRNDVRRLTRLLVGACSGPWSHVQPLEWDVLACAFVVAESLRLGLEALHGVLDVAKLLSQSGQLQGELAEDAGALIAEPTSQMLALGFGQVHVPSVESVSWDR